MVESWFEGVLNINQELIVFLDKLGDPVELVVIEVAKLQLVSHDAVLLPMLRRSFVRYEAPVVQFAAHGSKGKYLASGDNRCRKSGETQHVDAA